MLDTSIVNNMAGLENSFLLVLVVLNTFCIPLLSGYTSIVFIAWLVSLGALSLEAHSH